MSRKKIFVVLALAVCVLATAGGLLASNMGFKLNYLLQSTTGGQSLSGKQIVSLPYFRQTGVDNAFQLMLDIGGGAVTNIASVSKYNKSTDLYQTYIGRMGAGTPFNLAAGEGYLVQMNTTANYIIVGAHDPSLSTLLTGPSGVGGVGTGKQLYAPPYNITAANAFQLMQDVGGGGVVPIGSVSRYNRASDLFVTYIGRMGAGTPFALVAGDSYLVQMNTNVPYIASHY